MCGIFGLISRSPVSSKDLNQLSNAARRRGKDSSGLVVMRGNEPYAVYRAALDVRALLADVSIGDTTVALGHSRLITNGNDDNQPVVRDGVIVIHNGIIVNADALWTLRRGKRQLEVDTEIIAAIVAEMIEDGESLDTIASYIARECRGTVSCAIAVPALGKLVLLTNNGSLYVGDTGDGTYFYSEEHALTEVGCSNVRQVQEPLVLDIPQSAEPFVISNLVGRSNNLVPALGSNAEEEKSLQHMHHQLRRCSRCILPETMPFIRFDDQGICNYCKHYKPKNKLKSRERFLELLERYRLNGNVPCIVPFSGGRDSTYAIHVIVKELGIRPITMTYDWGMVTDLARRNISRVCSQLKLENIIIADDIEKKRGYIRKNLQAWLKRPHLGMLNLLMAGDKHFFRHIESVKQETGIELNLWGMNPLEVTHFKAGFLGFPPDFETEQVFYTGTLNQLKYQWLRIKEVAKNPAYLNDSIWDTLSGEFYRSVKKKTGFHNIFDYWDWNEQHIDSVLDSYDWERAPDTRSTWRIGDGTAAFYNYVYYTVAGFSEFDTFRSNQIREGVMTREEALAKVAVENQPRYPNIKWYLDAIGMDFKSVIQRVNSIPRLY
jgi:glutamine---fructose-6-phosphate transaminase (isomerizing)